MFVCKKGFRGPFNQTGFYQHKAFYGNFIIGAINGRWWHIHLSAALDLHGALVFLKGPFLIKPSLYDIVLLHVFFFCLFDKYTHHPPNPLR